MTYETIDEMKDVFLKRQGFTVQEVEHARLIHELQKDHSTNSLPDWVIAYLERKEL